ncbi:hypothetical protein [Proteiniborus sp.]|uniref:hypothetical protein n=1 Tax=Proteiniborus sp. TaxID=2079015 RepID=UPI0033278D84
MNKYKKIAVIIVCIFMVVNIWTMLSLKDQVKNLKNEVGRMHSNFSNDINYANRNIYNMQNELLDAIEKGDSLLASFETEVEYKNERLEVTVKVVPKEKRSDETVYLSIGDEKKETSTVNDSEYTATFVFEMPRQIIPTVSFESPTGIRQEVLPEINIDKLLALGYESRWDAENTPLVRNTEILTLVVYTQDEKSSSLLKGTPTATIVIRDNYTDTEIGRKEMQPTEIKESFIYELDEAIYFNVDLSDYLKKEGSYAVWVEIKTEGGIFYSEEIASFSNEANQGYSAGSGTGELYPKW